MESTLDVAQRWQMGPEARALVILTGVLLAFGLATVYSASAIVEMQAGYGHAHLLVRQVTDDGDIGHAAHPRTDKRMRPHQSDRLGDQPRRRDDIVVDQEHT